MPGNESSDKLDKVVEEANRKRAQRELSYRERALKMYPWICGKCEREFNQKNLQELTVHHKDHNHDNNPDDGSNWELLCIYCHDNEHSRLIDSSGEIDLIEKETVTHNPFASLGELIKKQSLSKDK